MSLACGGRGPCCHVGYAHRHCEHCDVVIPLTYHYPHFLDQHFYYQQPYSGVWYGNNGGLASQINALANQTYQAQSLGQSAQHLHEETN